MKIQIDTERCSGHGLCYSIAPKLFRDDERGFGVVLGGGTIADEDLEDAQQAAIACPERAITIE